MTPRRRAVLVLEDTAASTAGGAEASMHAFAEALAQHHEVHLAYEHPGDYVDAEASVYASTTRVSLEPLRWGGMLRWTRATIALIRLCRARNIAVVVTHTVHALPMLRILKAVCGIRVHVIFKWICSTQRAGTQAAWGLRGLDDCAAVSASVARYWIESGARAERMHVIPEGVPAPPATGRTPAVPYRDPREPLRVAFAGRIVPGKGLDVLIDACARLCSDSCPVEIVVMGAFRPDGPRADPYHAQLLAKIRASAMEDRTRFLGYVHPLRDALSHTDVVVVPSTAHDSQPLVLMHAMAVGVPVLASRIGGIPDILEGELDHLLFAPGDSEELARKISAIAALPPAARGSLGETLAERIRARYGMRASHERLAMLLGLSLDQVAGLQAGSDPAGQVTLPLTSGTN